MVNFGLNSAAILGIFLAVAGAGLYFLRSIRPELARDRDIFFSAVGLLCGGILLTQGWRLDPILQFGQFLLTGSTIFFAYEAIRLRGVATEVVKRNTPIVDDDRPVSKVYRYDQEAELYDEDRLEPEEDRYVNRRLRGTADSRNGRIDRYEGEVRRSKSRGNSERSEPGERPSKRRSRPPSRPSERPVESWDADLDSRSTSRPSQRSGARWNADSDGESGWEEKPTRSSRSRSNRNSESRDLETASKPRKRRPPQDRDSSPPPQDVDAIPTDYVDYQPIDSSEEERDRSGRFDY
jgi:hypothetical protein